MLAVRVWFLKTGVLTLSLVTTTCTDAMQIKTSHNVASAPMSLTRRRHNSLYNTKNLEIYIFSQKTLKFQSHKNFVCTDNAPNKKDAMRCFLDRKEVRCTTWRVHSIGTNQPVKTQDAVFDVWQAGPRRPD